MCQLSTCPHKGLGRRGFMAAVGAAFAAPVLAGGRADAILLSCMDFRLMDDLAIMMNQMQYRDSYDHVVLAGAALGAVHPQFEPWHNVFWEHVGMAVSLHAVREIMVINHRDCGAAKLAFGESVVADPKAEFTAHATVFAQFSETARNRFPELHVKGFLMNLDGTVERLRADMATANGASLAAAQAADPSGH